MAITDNCKYFLTIVYGHSRATWIYLMPYKSSALDILQNFVKFVQVHFDKRIKIIRSDNGLEFTSKKCGKFFSENGIIHQKSCVYRPQQNGLVERKHRHVLEISRSLRFHSHLPLKLWGYCVLTVA